LLICGLSADSPKANANFKFKQNLPYSLLCDSTSSLISAIGFKRLPRGTIRGVFAVDKGGKVLLLEAGGPAATVNAVQRLVEDTAPFPSDIADKDIRRESNEARNAITSSSV
jgi:peroxiredoxin Q/BCP